MRFSCMNVIEVQSRFSIEEGVEFGAVSSSQFLRGGGPEGILFVVQFSFLCKFFELFDKLLHLFEVRRMRGSFERFHGGFLFHIDHYRILRARCQERGKAVRGKAEGIKGRKA